MHAWVVQVRRRTVRLVQPPFDFQTVVPWATSSSGGAAQHDVTLWSGAPHKQKWHHRHQLFVPRLYSPLFLPTWVNKGENNTDFRRPAPLSLPRVWVEKWRKQHRLPAPHATLTATSLGGSGENNTDFQRPTPLSVWVEKWRKQHRFPAPFPFAHNTHPPTRPPTDPLNRPNQPNPTTFSHPPRSAWP
jgi:hypothetical protein